MKLKDFIGMQEKKPWEYNFEWECGDEEFLNLKTFERYFTYRALSRDADSIYKNANKYIKYINSKLEYSNVYDPDGSGYELTRDIYSMLWNWNKEEKGPFRNIDKYPFTASKFRFGGDTMNSVQSAFNNVFENSKFLEKYQLPSRKGSISTNYMLECMQTKRDFCDLLTEHFECSDMNIIEYIEYYHTLGNFILVPKGFNSDRGSKLTSDQYKKGYEYNKKTRKYEKEINDFWDRSLVELHTNGYYGFKDTDFTNYINFFFSWDCVEPKNGEYQVKLIGVDEKGTRDYATFFKKTVKIIERRGKFMTAMLIIVDKDDKPNLNKDKDDTLYERIQKILVGEGEEGNKMFKGVDDAAREILEKFGEEIPDKAKSILEELKQEKL